MGGGCRSEGEGALACEGKWLDDAEATLLCFDGSLKCDCEGEGKAIKDSR